MTALLSTALLTGLLGSLHCAAMCGPLAIAGSAGGRAPSYLAGRLLSYAAIGALLGLVGRHALCLLPVGVAGWAAAAGVGAFALWKAIALLRAPRAAGAAPVALGRRRVPLLARALARLPRRGLGLGLATGILPCGMLIPAWTLAMGAGGPLEGAALMAVFSLGSAPGLLVPVLAGRAVGPALARIPRAAQSAAWFALALWIAARPLLGAVHQH